MRGDARAKGALTAVLGLGCALIAACVPAPERGRGRAPTVDAAAAEALDAAAEALDAAAAEALDAAAAEALDAAAAEALDAAVVETADAAAPAPDAETALDAAEPARDPDASVGADAFPAAADAEAAPADAGVVTCTAEGAPGVCIDVSACAAPAHPVPGHCPGPAQIQCCVDTSAAPACDPTAQVTPHAGLAEAPGLGGCPPGMSPAGQVCIDRFEAVLFEVAADGTTSAWSPFFNPGSRRVRAASIEGAVPQGYISGRQAALACAEAQKRLCTDAEWLRACRGPAGTPYPYGGARQPGVCNDARAQHPAIEYFGTSDAWIWSELDHPCINQLHDSVALTGAHPGCVTAEGALDMMGNLHEWTADPAGTFRGGYYVDTVINGSGCLYATTAHDVGHWDYSTGFRCCADLP